jgi:hypothetical protein
LEAAFTAATSTTTIATFHALLLGATTVLASHGLVRESLGFEKLLFLHRKGKVGLAVATAQSFLDKATRSFTTILVVTIARRHGLFFDLGIVFTGTTLLIGAILYCLLVNNSVGSFGGGRWGRIVIRVRTAHFDWLVFWLLFSKLPDRIVNCVTSNTGWVQAESCFITNS